MHVRSLLLVLPHLAAAAYFTPPPLRQPRRVKHRNPAMVVAEIPAAVSLGAGMLGGSIGVGVAYPLDTLKTKLQARETCADEPQQSPLSVAIAIVKEEGIGGFYGGVSSTMAGQAAIKGVVFFVYEWAKGAFSGLSSVTLSLILAACLSGAVGSFVVTPVERIKCVMQATEVGTYSSPLACIAQLRRTDGFYGLLTRGLGATLLREVPAYAFYFVSYDLVKTHLLSASLVPASIIPLVGGAVAGAMAWVPVYPVDVVKTNIQVLDGSGGDDGFVGTAKKLWAAGGVWAFWDGIGPKLARAVVNHAVTFYVFDFVCALPIWT